ncbi:hypothetical protein Tcan_13284 [Toxocara canis]|uniref:Uncharacterized protein n=2 Tax=Toxocara canis TaxID=6265 RepID=A0A0B2VVS3_TOXCA|nr:hypothetical protein Tcan_13284 [Toxocara canis]VDM36810.1 unnamed protein product [Toxocara canis]
MVIGNDDDLLVSSDELLRTDGNRRSTNNPQPATIPALNLLAGIVANQVSFLRIAPRTVTFPGTCNANLRWEMGTPPLVINSIQCVLSNLAGGG